MRVRTGLVVPKQTGEYLAPRLEPHGDGEPPWARVLLVLACAAALVSAYFGWAP
jgi:hypothetical protein